MDIWISLMFFIIANSILMYICLYICLTSVGGINRNEFTLTACLKNVKGKAKLICKTDVNIHVHQ